MEIDREEFENPYRPEGYSYTVIDCQKKCHSVEYRTMTNFRRKIASLQTAQGFTRYYYTGEFTFDDEISSGSSLPHNNAGIRTLPSRMPVNIVCLKFSAYPLAFSHRAK